MTSSSGLRKFGRYQIPYVVNDTAGGSAATRPYEYCHSTWLVGAVSF